MRGCIRKNDSETGYVTSQYFLKRTEVNHRELLYEQNIFQQRFKTGILRGYSHTTARRMVPAYTNCDIQLQNVAPDDGLKSPKHVKHLMINKDAL